MENMLTSLELISKLSESLSSSDITNDNNNNNNKSNEVSASRKRLDSIATKRLREEEQQEQQQEQENMNNEEQHQMPLINIRKPKKSRFFADPVFSAISETKITLPDNWNTLNTQINNNKQNNNNNISNAKKQKQEKGSNYNDRMKSKISAKKVKTQKKMKQKNGR